MPAQAAEPDVVPHRCARGPRCVDHERTSTGRTTGWENCPCSCHGRGPRHPCDEDGGCGYQHTDPADTFAYLGASIPNEVGLCPGCQRSIESDIVHLKGDVVELSMRIAADGSGEGDKVSATREAPTPLRLSYEALRAEIVDEAQTWAQAVAEQLGVDWPSTTALRGMRLGPRVDRAIDLLRHSIPTLVALPAQELPLWEHDGTPAYAIDLESDPGPGAWRILERSDCWPFEPLRATTFRSGLDGALRLVRLHGRAYQLLGRTKLVHQLPARCPWCWQRTLVRDNGSDHVQCESSRCRGRSIDEKHYSWLVSATVAVESQMPAEDAA